jgi:hypothetical protein
MKTTEPVVVCVDGALFVVDSRLQVARSKFSLVFDASTGTLEIYDTKIFQKNAVAVEDTDQINCAMRRYCSWLNSAHVSFWKEKRRELMARVEVDLAEERKQTQLEQALKEPYKIAQPNEYLARGESYLFRWHHSDFPYDDDS